MPVPRIVWLKDGRRVILRAARGADADAVQEFVRGLSVQSRRNRFFSPVRELSPHQIESLIGSPAAGGLALVAEAIDATGLRIVALAQYVVSLHCDAEFAVVVDDAWQRQGLGNDLLGVLAEHAARSGLASFAGFVLPDNWPMLTLLSRLGCEFVVDAEPDAIRVIRHFDFHGRARSHRGEASTAADACAPDLQVAPAYCLC
ncbi:MAG TPA: hypothetical protein VHB46_05995 [Burkholderiales bacterium]|nr:hypothetical protein [Burkholderiales bacterium]